MARIARIGTLVAASLALFVAGCGSEPRATDGVADAADVGVSTDSGATDAGDAGDAAPDADDTGRDTAPADTGGEDAAIDVADAASDTTSDTGSDAADAAPDVADTGADVPPDADPDSGADVDVGPPLDVRLTLNEIHCQGPDWIELFNAGTDDAPLGGYVVADDPTPEDGYAFADDAVVPAGGWFTVYRGDDFDFGVACGDDVIRLFAPDGSVVDARDVPELTREPASDGRIPDGDGEWTECALTPDAANEVTTALGPDDWFDARDIRRVDITLPEDSEAALRREPREYVAATLEIRDEDIGPMTVAIRVKGGLGSTRNLDQKTAFKIDLNRYAPDQTVYGMTEFTFNNMVQDPSVIHEFTAYTLFRAMGVPAPRVRYIELYVNEELWGLYLSVEAWNDESLATWFDETMHLYEGAYGQDIEPADVEDFDVDEGPSGDRTLLMALAVLLDTTPIDEAYAATADLVDWDLVIRSMAVEHWTGHWDGYAPTQNNYFIHFDGDGIASILPWGTDQTFVQRRDVTEGRGLLFNVCVADWACYRTYLETLIEIGEVAAEIDLAGDALDLAASVRAAYERDARREASMSRHDTVVAQTYAYIRGRAAEIDEVTACLLGPDADPDGDGARCEADCAPDDPTIYPGAAEICGDGIDQDCSGAADDSLDCPDCIPTELATGSYLICPNRRTWVEAVEHCADDGATLVQIDSAAQSVVSQDWWLGLNDRETEGRFVWFDGTVPTYTNWRASEPNNAAGGEDCGQFYRGPQWNDIPCTTRQGVICELPAAP